MNRTVRFQLNRVRPTPTGLRADPTIDAPALETSVNLGQLFLQYYFDSYPSGPPNPDPSRFEYLQLVSSASEFRLHAHVTVASTVKKRSLSTEMGQAFCRLMLHDHFGIAYFAHMTEVLNKPTHAAFEGMRIERTSPGDVPDYLCARKVTVPHVAEAKGRFSSISFASAEFKRWREQFTRIRVVDRAGIPKVLKGFIVGTRFATETNSATVQTTTFIEDPDVRERLCSQRMRVRSLVASSLPCTTGVC